jgi:hypothetical protein
MTGSLAYQEILFADHFQHEQSDVIPLLHLCSLETIKNLRFFFISLEILNLDHIKFAYPVYIDEVRIVPNGCTVGLSNNISFNG